ncbi:MAG: hypothetical protein RR334_00090 [Clostridia bacterium]
MEMDKKSLILCVIATLLCLGAGVVCAIIRKFDIVSAILLAVIIVFAIIVTIAIWRVAVVQKKAKIASQQVVEEKVEDKIAETK